MSLAKEMELNEGWRLCLVDDAALDGEITRFSQLNAEAVPAQVPGDWPLDYVRAGKLDDPYYQDNYLKIRGYENSHVFYGGSFRWDGGLERVFLRFEGIDTVADVYLNGRKIGHAENMYIPHEFPAESLVQGENELLVHILPVGLEARQYHEAAFVSTCKYNYEALVIRKATHMFGWDICPRIVSSGLWRPVRGIQKKPLRIDDVFVWIDRLEDGCAKCTAMFDIDIGREPVSRYALRLTGVCGDSRFEACEALWYVHGRIRFDVENPKLWWPRGYGDPDQYEITATLLRDGVPVDEIAFRQGLRTAELVRDDVLDENDEGEFCFVINHRRIYVKGTNWVPADAFHSNDPQRIPRILELVKDVGCNAMRVWGGGVYESDFFYDWCDENGILIWQDFMMACGVYPLTERMKRQLEEEATVQVRRLRRHASICLWAGDNECDQNYCWFDLKQDPSLNELTRIVLPRVIRAEDLTRPYLPSSPYVSGRAYADGCVESTPEQHLWGPRDYFKGHFYHDANAVFASEMGYHGCNSPQSLYRFIGREQSWPVDGNPMVLYHAASPELEHSPYTYRIPLMSGQLRFLFEQEPANLDEYARMSQISQAEAKKFFVESFRSRKGRRTGLIWWNIMDCWPQISDAVVDYYFCKKLAYFYIRRSQQPVCLMMDDHTGELALYGVSDLDRDMTVSYRVRDLDSDETVAAGKTRLAADASTPLCPIRDDGKVRFYAIEWENGDGMKGTNHYLQGKPKYDYKWYLGCLEKMGYNEFEGFER